MILRKTGIVMLPTLVYVLLPYHVMMPATKLDWVWKIYTLRTRSGSHQFNFYKNFFLSFKCLIDFNFGLTTFATVNADKYFLCQSSLRYCFTLKRYVPPF
ncbi:Uncharacterized protein APZ42_004180 [Daphnia magna]|uniref:Uncharacterized protein n=1 Tax=Daphnia magna TaxID=35525 RepID=A0A164H7V0_9CRUS|nr:Uncharacterized protein APZ42_004180 [Daphnia magna]